MKKNMQKTALVKNPSTRSLNVSGGKVTTKRNPKPQAKTNNKNTKKTTTVKKPTTKRNPSQPQVVYKYRAKTNPIGTVGGLLTAALFAGVSVAAFDFVTSKILPAPISAPVRIGVKGVSGFAIAQWGGRLPLLGAYSKEIGLVLITLAIVDGVQTYAMPIVNNVADKFTPASRPAAPVESEMSDDYYYDDDYYDDDDEMGDDYDDDDDYYDDDDY